MDTVKTKKAVLKVLIVEEEADFREFLKMFIRMAKREKVEIRTAERLTEEALEFLKEEGQKLVFLGCSDKNFDLDKMLPRFVKYPNSKIVIMSAYIAELTERHHLEVLKNKPIFFLHKPLNPVDEQLLNYLLFTDKDIEEIFKDFTLKDILLLLELGGLSALIYIREHNYHAKIWIKEGRIIHAIASIGEEVLKGERALKSLPRELRGRILALPFKEPLEMSIDQNESRRFIAKALFQGKEESHYELSSDEDKAIIEKEKANLKGFENRNKDKLIALWVINRSGKIIYRKIVKKEILKNTFSLILEEIKSDFRKWIEGLPVVKERIVMEGNPFSLVLKTLSMQTKYFIVALLKEEAGNLKILKEKGGIKMPTPENIKKAIEILTGIENSEGAAVVSNEGLVLEAHLDPKYDPDKIGALISVALEAANRVTKEAGWGGTDNMVIEGDNGKMVLYSIPIGFIVLIGRKNMNLGLARIQVDEAASLLGG